MAAIQIKTTSKVVPKCYAYTTPGVPAYDGWTKIRGTHGDSSLMLSTPVL